MNRRVKKIDVLRQAIRVVKERQATHGDFLGTHENIVELWNSYLSIRPGGAPQNPLTAKDAALMMLLLKVARTTLSDGHNPDNYVDLAGYSAGAGEIAAATEGK